MNDEGIGYKLPYNRNPVRVLTQAELERLLARTKYLSWLTVACRKGLIDAIAARKELVTLDRPGWKEFKIEYKQNKEGLDYVYVKPHGHRAPFGPSAWINISKLIDDGP